MATRKIASKKKSQKKFARQELFMRRKAVFFGAAAVALLFGALGVQYLYMTFASPGQNKRNGTEVSAFRLATSGPCAGQLETFDERGLRVCSHEDPGPPGVDLVKREQNLEVELNAMVRHDQRVAPSESDDPIPRESSAYEPSDLDYADPADAMAGGSLAKVAARNWPCVSTGSDGARVQFVYIYRDDSSITGLSSTRRSQFETIARRMNNVFYYSGYESGASKQPRYLTSQPVDGKCSLSIAALKFPTRTYNINTMAGVTKFMEDRGSKSNNRKYVLWIEKGPTTYPTCGQGRFYPDDKPTADNANNIYYGYSVVWYHCWNYGEPHELMHSLGSVNLSAPHKTAGYHCYDQHDVMCYDDDGNSTTYPIQYICKRYDSNLKYYIDAWRFDCGHNDYFAGKVSSTSNYLYNHWNTAKSRFLYPNPQ